MKNKDEYYIPIIIGGALVGYSLLASQFMNHGNNFSFVATTSSIDNNPFDDDKKHKRYHHYSSSSPYQRPPPRFSYEKVRGSPITEPSPTHITQSPSLPHHHYHHHPYHHYINSQGQHVTTKINPHSTHSTPVVPTQQQQQHPSYTHHYFKHPPHRIGSGGGGGGMGGGDIHHTPISKRTTHSNNNNDGYGFHKAYGYDENDYQQQHQRQGSNIGGGGGGGGGLGTTFDKTDNINNHHFVGIDDMGSRDWNQSYKYNRYDKQQAHYYNSPFLTTDSSQNPQSVFRLYKSTGKKISGSHFAIHASDEQHLASGGNRPSYRFQCAQGCNVPFKDLEATVYARVGQFNGDNPRGDRFILGTGGGLQDNKNPGCCIYSLGFDSNGHPYAEEEGTHIGGPHIRPMQIQGNSLPGGGIGNIAGRYIGLKTVIYHQNGHTIVEGWVDPDKRGWQRFYRGIDPHASGFPSVSGPFNQTDTQEVRARIDGHSGTVFDADRTEVHEIDAKSMPDVTKGLPPPVTGQDFNAPSGTGSGPGVYHGGGFHPRGGMGGGGGMMGGGGPRGGGMGMPSDGGFHPRGGMGGGGGMMGGGGPMGGMGGGDSNMMGGGPGDDNNGGFGVPSGGGDSAPGGNDGGFSPGMGNMMPDLFQQQQQQQQGQDEQQQGSEQQQPDNTDDNSDNSPDSGPLTMDQIEQYVDELLQAIFNGDQDAMAELDNFMNAFEQGLVPVADVNVDNTTTTPVTNDTDPNNSNVQYNYNTTSNDDSNVNSNYTSSSSSSNPHQQDDNIKDLLAITALIGIPLLLLTTNIVVVK